MLHSCFCFSRRLGLIDVSVKLLNLLLSIHLESRYERKCEVVGLTDDLFSRLLQRAFFKSMFIIQLFVLGSSSLETWLLETKCAKMTFGKRVLQIFSCKFGSTCVGDQYKVISNHIVYCALKYIYWWKLYHHYESTLMCVSRRLLSVDDVKAVDYASMVLHTCLDGTKVVELSKPQNIQVAFRVMELCQTHPDLDWM